MSSSSMRLLPSSKPIHKNLMKTLFLFPFILLTIALPAQASPNVEFYRDFLDPNAADYPQRRAEALSKARYQPKMQSDRIHEYVISSDLAYMSTATSFRDLWKLRYQAKWEPEILLAVADTARFYIQYCDTDIEMGFSQDVGVLHHILQQLRDSDGLKAKLAFRDLAAAIREVKNRRAFETRRQENESTIKTEMNEQMLDLRGTLDQNFRKALMKALMKSAQNLRNRLWQSPSFVGYAIPLHASHHSV